jgi:hypothetical protein
MECPNHIRQNKTFKTVIMPERKGRVCLKVVQVQEDTPIPVWFKETHPFPSVKNDFQM